MSYFDGKNGRGTGMLSGAAGGSDYVLPDPLELNSLTLLQQDPYLPPTPGQFVMNQDEGTVDLGLDGDVVLQLGQEIHYHVHNTTAGIIPNGTLVMAVGTHGASGKISVAPMIVGGAVEPRTLLGMATADIHPDQFGYVTHFGKVRGLDTSMFTAGTVLWADPAVQGGLTGVQPEAPFPKLPVGYVITAHAIVGTVFVRVETGANLGDLHNVHIPVEPTDGSLLTFDVAQQRWVAAAPAAPVAALADLTDVDVPAPTNGSVLTFDATAEKWVAAEPPTAPAVSDDTIAMIIALS